MSVYVEMFPDQVQQLLKYSFLIRQMAKSFPGYAWRSYDEQFRQSRSITKWPWDKVIQELYMSSVSVAFAATAHPTAPTWQQRRPPMRFPGGYGQRPNIRPFRQQARAPFNYSYRATILTGQPRGVITPVNTHRLQQMLVGYSRPKRDGDLNMVSELVSLALAQLYFRKIIIPLN
jgi:hypothetical protein